MAEEIARKHDSLAHWQNCAAAVLAQFLNLGAHPDEQEWALVALEATRLLNTDDLRHYTGVGTGYSPVMMMQRAAEEIDRLRAEAATMREALKYVQDFERNRGGNWFDLREIVDEALTRPNA